MNHSEKIQELLNGVNKWSDLKSKLEKFNTSQTDTTTKDTEAGKLFEHFSKAYFISEPEQNQLYKNVWLFDEIPLSIKEKLNFPQKDFGIDILLQDNADRFTAVQCKFKNDEQSTLNWSKDKIGNAFGLAEKCDCVLVFTNTSNIHIVAQTREKFKFIGYSDLLNLQAQDFEALRQYFQLNRKPEFKKLEPLNHQKEAISEVIKHFKVNDKGQLILPCGAGKTLTALWIKENLKVINTLVLFPSLALLRQFKTEWSKNRSYDFEYICVCSEKDIDNSKEDTTVTHTYEISGEVTTNPDRVNTFLNSNGSKIIFSTYQSLEVTAEALKKNPSFSFDLIICDEAHRTAGGKNNNLFTLVHNPQKIRGKKRLYMTATPKVVSNKFKKTLGEDYELLCDMSNPDIFGTEAYRMSFGIAIQKEILVDYKIIGIGVTHKQVKEFIDKRRYITDKFSYDEVARNYALDIAMDKYKAFHCITFHHQVQLAREFSERHKSFFGDTVYAKHVEGKQPTSYRSSVLNEFRNSPKGIVSNARCLTEGVDVPTIDLIYFSDPKTSKIDIVQASGRALRKDWHGKKKMGYIVVPIFHYKDDDIEKEIEKQPFFKNLISVIRSLCDQDERLQAEIDGVAFEKGQKISKRIELSYDDEEIEKIIKLDGLEKKVREYLFDQIIEKTRNYWNVKFQQLKEFIEKFGHSTISKGNLEYRDLYYWCGNLRKYYHLGTLDKTKIKRLNDIGFDWKGEQRENYLPPEEKWQKNFDKLKKYFDENGHTNVPARYEKDKPLGTWCVGQRVKYDNGKLEDWQIDLFEQINFDWDPKNKFDEYYNELIKFKEENGHLRVPTQGSDKYKALGRWVNKLRVVYNAGNIDSKGDMVALKKGRIRANNLKKLNEIGFVWNAGRGDWNARFKELQQYFLQNGHSNVSQTDDMSLYYWCYRHKKNHKNLTKEKLGKLKSVNFDFTIRAVEDKLFLTWAERIEQLKDFYDENGNYDIPKDDDKYKKLLYWLRHQRSKQLKGKLTEEQENWFTKINFSLNDFFSNEESISWVENLKKLKQLYADTDSFYIATGDSELGSLLNWLRYQKSLYRQGTLEQNKIDRLKEIGYSFEISYRGKKGSRGVSTNFEPDENWFLMYEELKKYVEENKTFLIPQKAKEFQSLASWVRYQKSLFRKELLGDTKINLLNKIEFPFTENFRGKTISSIKKELNPTIKENKPSQWNKRFEELKSYYSQHQSFRIPTENKELQPLGSWIRYQRILYREGKLEAEKIKKLLDIGYSFDFDFRGRKPNDENSNFEDWETRLFQLEEFYKENGTFLIKGNDKENADLLQWLRYQRILKNKGKLSTEQLNAFERIGYSFDIKYYGQGREKKKKEEKPKKPSNNLQSWETNYLKLLEFKMSNGHCNVPKSYQDKTLANYVTRQRYNYKKENIPQEQIKKLEFLGFEWDVDRSTEFRDVWMEKYNELKQVFKSTGNCFVSKKDNKTLSSWKVQQRVKRKKDALSSDQIKLLNEIKFDWEPELKGGTPDDEQWFEKFQELEAYKKKFGDCNVSQLDKIYRKLGRWLNDQRLNYTRGKLFEHRKELLEELGVIWNIKEHEWNLKWQMLHDFFNKHGHFNVKQTDNDFSGLYNWLFRIKKYGTTFEKWKRLTDLGFDTSIIKIIR